MPKIKTTLGDWIEALSSEGATPEEIASRYGEQYESLSPKDLKSVTSPELDVARSQSANLQKYGPGFVRKFSEPLENIRQSQEASKMSGFGEFAEAEKDINKTRALIDDLGPLEKEALANAYKEGSTGKQLMKMFMDSKAGKLASGTAELAGKGIGIAGKVAEPLIAYSSGKEFLEEIKKSPEFLSMSPDEKREFIAKATGSLGETIGAGVGTAATGAQLLAGGIGSGTLAAAAAPFIVPAAGLTGTAMLSKYMGPHLAKGAEEASAMPGGTMASRLGGDPNAENPEIASRNIPLSTLEKQEVEKLFGKNRTDNPFMMAGEEEKKPTALDLQEAPSLSKALKSTSIPTEKSVSSEEKQMQDIVNLERQQGADYAKRLEEAERKARENEALGLFSKAISQISGGVAQAKAKADLGKVDTSIADEFLKTAGKPLEELKRSIEMERNDPNSAASKSLRAIAQRELKSIGMNVDVSGMSYAQIKDIFPQIEKRAERLETAKLRQQQAADLRYQREQLKFDKEESKKRDEQNRFLDKAQGRFAKDKSHEAFFIMKDAINQIDNYIKNPTPESSKAMAYAFAKINDPQTGVRDAELKLFGKAGSLFDQFKETIRAGLTGKMGTDRAQRFRNFVADKLTSYESDLKTKLSPYVEQGKRYGLDEQDVISNVAGPEYYQNLFKGTKMSDDQRKELMELRKLQQK